MIDEPWGDVALTFDDGPSEWTEAIIDQLQAHGARATFFVLGCHIAGREHILRRALDAGCEVAVHGFSHRRLTALTDGQIEDEMAGTMALVASATGQTPRLWRAPRFDVDARVRSVCARLGLREVWLTADTEDYLRGSDEVAARGQAGLRPGAIILLHDGRSALDTPDESLATRAGTVVAVPAILAEGRRRGLTMGTVSELRGDWRRRSSRAIGAPSRSAKTRARKVLARLLRWLRTRLIGTRPA